jgi:carboxypeptidase C (cathepsin A)
VYSGDHDFVVPFTGTRSWVYSLGLNTLTPYAAWYTPDGQVAGFSTTFAQGLTFATVLGAGHMVPQTRPAAALRLLERFLFPYDTR